LTHRVSDVCGNSDETLSSSSFQAFCPVLRIIWKMSELMERVYRLPQIGIVGNAISGQRIEEEL
jgi:hypothetical protein